MLEFKFGNCINLTYYFKHFFSSSEYNVENKNVSKEADIKTRDTELHN